jgi:hypothetical protein
MRALNHANGAYGGGASVVQCAFPFQALWVCTIVDQFQHLAFFWQVRGPIETRCVACTSARVMEQRFGT